MLTLEVITSIILVMVMIYFNAIQIAYLSIDLNKIDMDSIKDKKKVKKLKIINNKSGFFTSSIRSLITFCSLWLSALIVEIVAMPLYRKLNISMISTSYIVKYFIILIVTLILTYALYVFAETIPKTIAIKNKNKIIKSNIDIMYIVPYIFSPFNKIMVLTEKVIMAIFNVRPKEKISYKDSEMKETVEVSTQMGILSKQDGSVISNYLRLDEMTAQDIMIPVESVIMIDIESSKNDIKEAILKYGYTRIPVYNKDRRDIIGIINTKNILKGMLSNEKLQPKSHLKDCMKVSPGKRLDLLFSEMKKQKEHMAIVVKEKGIALGIVTMEDIIEEIVGNIEDDFEKYNN